MRLSLFTPMQAVFFFVCGVSLLSAPAHADSFDSYRVAYSSGSVANIGLTDSGTLTTRSAGTLLYSTFTPGAGSVVSATLPPFAFDNGSSCSVSSAGLVRVSMARCNGTYSLFSAYTATSYLPSLYLLAGGTLQTLYYGGVSNLLLNALGDVAFVGLYGSDQDTNFLYYNTTSHAAAAVTPEPSSLLLLLSGFGCLGFLTRKRNRVLTA